MLRAVYVDLDGTLLGPGGSLFAAPDGGGFSLDAARALQACHRAGVEVVIYTGRKQPNAYEIARLIGSRSYIFDLGCGLVLDGELEWLTGAVVPSVEGGTIYDQITSSGAAQALLDAFPGRLEYHHPWSEGREVSHLFRGNVALDAAAAVLEAGGWGWLRLVDNGVIAAGGFDVMHGRPVVRVGSGLPGSGAGQERPGSEVSQERPGSEVSQERPGSEVSQERPGSEVSQERPGSEVSQERPGSEVSQERPGSEVSQERPGTATGWGVEHDIVKAYHLIPRPASKAAAVARHMQNRGYSPPECIACGDSREDMDAADVVGTFWMMANGVQRDPAVLDEIAHRANVRIAEGATGTGVYEAVVTTLAEG